MARVLLVLLAVGLAVYALVDLSSSDEDERGGIPKGLWVVLIVLLPFVGAIAWILVRRSQRSATRYGGGGRFAAGRPGPARRRRSGPVAPDDDPEFLWRLEQEQRRQGRSPGTDGKRDAADDGRSPEPGPGEGTDADGDQSGTNPGQDGPGSR
ncbi:PLD nuclease N-terminal domain-containing protein [Cellulosimicrobium cellulans]|uniref:PLD nuclease N-terminal domain-containing protein n=1 Tax=Cellulosimicrobium cellulans TaxID=1710 RepID=UPI000848D2A0|nr:PLD nuclease N-terminal domain-containing protein [Cellulosimicrobium cellulans]